jgi:glycine/D-amino acid oxidase-like deaminating enzyme
MQTGLLVVGGGTSGNAAAYAAAGLGIQTVCLERGFELGGTNTLGGVTNLWYGKRTKAFEDYYAAMDAKNDGLNAPGFYRGVRKAGARILFGCATTGVAQEGRNVRRVYVITPFGLVAVEAPRFIDATGDGAIAAWAGCAYSFGGEHDELTLWASFAGYKPGRPEALRPFLSPCDERSALDTTRFILSMRRNSKVPLEQKHVPPPFYVAPRESRHIRGGKTLTFLDLLAGRRFVDGVFRVESNPDIKGLATSDAAKAGFIPTNWKALYQATIPYSALVPLTLDNVLIAGKAYSATHDALSAARMQRDLCVMGMVAANAVHLSVVSGKILRDIPVRDLQQTLIAKGMLKTTDLPEDDFGFKLAPEEMAKKVASTADLDESLAASAMLCLIPREKALAALEPFARAPHAGVERVLCFLGHPRGTERYLAEVEGALETSALSAELFGGKGTKHLMPDQGYAPVSALMLGSLAYSGERRAVALLARLASKIKVDPEDLQTELRSAWGYLYTLACGFERLACAEGRAPLRHVLGSLFEPGYALRRQGDLRACRNVPGERMAYLQMALSRALLRCGDVEGGVRLCEFLDEARVCLARAARSELAVATGRDFCFDAKAWLAWLAERGAEIRPNPLAKAFA